MPNSNDTELTDEQFDKASEEINRTIDILGMELKTSGIPMGMFMVGMARFMGHAIQEATSALPVDRREEQIEGFFKIIRLHAYETGGIDETKKEE